ncbi:MAG: hypothetical protein OXU23_20720, partial [Candidatus Poribacteria bacterium]|nr:hypothetical protein [Candidatus Poribacteria bacterium]
MMFRLSASIYTLDRLIYCGFSSILCMGWISEAILVDNCLLYASSILYKGYAFVDRMEKVVIGLTL